MTVTRLGWTAAIVLISIGGAGLATAADRPATDALRPELSVHADQVAKPWIEAMGSQAHAVDEHVDAVSQSGREVLGLLSSLDPQSVTDALAAGNQAADVLGLDAQTLADLRYLPPAALEENRLSQANRGRLAAIDEILGAALPMPATWHTLAANTRQVTDLLKALLQHDETVFRATTAGRQQDWAGALELLDESAASLASAREVRDNLAAANDVSTLDDLLSRYETYDEALVDLYAALRDGAALGSALVMQLNAKVDEAAAGLPTSIAALKVVVADATGATVADGVVGLEEARGIVAEAVSRLP
jgi:hypothetical protein